jgi:hypothetical protein
MKRSAAAVFIAVLTGVLVALVAPAANAHGPYCGIRWGSLPKDVSTSSTGHLVNIRAGRHKCFDRLVIDMDRDAAGYFVRYVDQVRADGSGAGVPLHGGARLEVVATVPAHNAQGQPTYRPTNRSQLVNVNGWRTFRQVAWAGSFEGQTTVGLGVRVRLPFRVFQLDGPGDGSRIVVDVAHRW